MIGGVPHHRELIEAMLAYDLIGFQTEEDCENFLVYVASRSRARRARRRRRSRAMAERALRCFRSASMPQKFAAATPPRPSTHPDVSRLRRSLNGEQLAIGVDRLDYSKGLVNRIKAFDRMWT